MPALICPERPKLLTACLVDCAEEDGGGQGPGQEDSELHEFDECQSCLYSLGDDAVRFGCGHVVRSMIVQQELLCSCVCTVVTFARLMAVLQPQKVHIVRHTKLP